MRLLRLLERALSVLLLSTTTLNAQAGSEADVHAQLSFAKIEGKDHTPAAVLWLKPLQDTPPARFIPSQTYTLLQKNRKFRPHLLVIPVGSVVQFPNADPFFHNVFSLFDGKRFDLGLYEAGSMKSVTFSREGVSYIFCNIHPEMSAVVLTLSTRLFSVASPSGTFHLANVPTGDYEMHVWIEGVPQPALSGLTRRVRLNSGTTELGKIEVPGGLPPPAPHTNMYGQPYDREVKPTY